MAFSSVFWVLISYLKFDPRASNFFFPNSSCRKDLAFLPFFILTNKITPSWPMKHYQRHHTDKLRSGILTSLTTWWDRTHLFHMSPVREPVITWMQQWRQNTSIVNIQINLNRMSMSCSSSYNLFRDHLLTFCIWTYTFVEIWREREM